VLINLFIRSRTRNFRRAYHPTRDNIFLSAVSVLAVALPSIYTFNSKLSEPMRRAVEVLEQ
jgi:hypothetical protein